MQTVDRPDVRQLVIKLLALPRVTGKLSKGEPTMFIGVPVKDNDGSVIAAFTIRINPFLEFIKIVQMAGTGLTGDSYVFDKSGKLISNSRFDEQLRTIGLIKEDEHAILNLKLLDPGGNLSEGFQPTLSRENLPLTSELLTLSVKKPCFKGFCLIFGSKYSRF